MSSSHRYNEDRNLALEAEGHMLGGCWEKAPEVVREKAEELLAERLPVGIAHHPTEGWMVLMLMVLMLMNGPGDTPTVAWRLPKPEERRRYGRRVYR